MIFLPAVNSHRVALLPQRQEWRKLPGEREGEGEEREEENQRLEERRKKGGRALGTRGG